MDSLPVEFSFRNPIVIGIRDSLFLPRRKAQAGFRCLHFLSLVERREEAIISALSANISVLSVVLTHELHVSTSIAVHYTNFQSKVT